MRTRGAGVDLRANKVRSSHMGVAPISVHEMFHA
jgi:hypothetical protein